MRKRMGSEKKENGEKRGEGGEQQEKAVTKRRRRTARDRNIKKGNEKRHTEKR